MRRQKVARTSRARIKEDVVFRSLEGEAVLLNLKTGVYFGLDVTGTRIWQLIQAHESLETVLDSLVEEYDVSETRCQEDLLHFISLLRENELIEVSDEAGA